MRKQIFAALIILIFGAVCYGQTEKSSGAPAQNKEANKTRCESRSNTADLSLTGASPAEHLPAGDGAWAIQITTTGGITGAGLPTLTITSDGEFFRESDETIAKKRLPAETFDVLREIIARADSVAATASEDDLPVLLDNLKTSVLICSDCYQRQVYVARRQADGTVKTFSDAARGKILQDDDFNRILRIAAALPTSDLKFKFS